MQDVTPMKSLNPYSIGICSRSMKDRLQVAEKPKSLNPYSNGIYSWRHFTIMSTNKYFNKS